MNFLTKNLYWLIAGVCGLMVLGGASRPPASSGKVDTRHLSQLPVVERGRIKPFDTAARTFMRVISGRDTFDIRTGDKKIEHPALEWFLDVASHPDYRNSPAMKYKIFRIDNDQILGMLGLKEREGFRYSMEEFADKEDKIKEEASRVNELQDKGLEPDLYERKILTLAEHEQEFLKVAQHRSPLVIPPKVDNPQNREDDWRSLSDLMPEFIKHLSEEAMNEAHFRAVRSVMADFRLSLEQVKAFKPEQVEVLRRLIASKVPHEALIALLADNESTALEKEMAREVATVPAAKAWVDLLKAYRAGDGERFNQAVQAYEETLTTVSPKDKAKARFEEWFNRASLFYWCTGLYVIAGVLACVSWLKWPDSTRLASQAVIYLTLIVHTFGLVSRMYIQARPPVTNLYSSAIFIGWGCVIGGLVLEWIWRNNVGNLIGSLLGFLTCIIAHNLGSDRDTLEMMQAVLDTNFWLATHVTIVTLGYTATFVSGFIGLMFILRGVLTTSLDERSFKELGQMLYGVICFATLLSFTGTVLGGIWADQSWGRFWGWDSKENGAVLVVLWNAIILHARWAGLVQQRGMAILAVAGNMVTAWSWFGTNMLGVGLHSYGFMDKAQPFLVGFWVSQLAIMGIGLIPPQSWRSFGGRFDPKPHDKPKLKQLSRKTELSAS